MLTKEYFDKLRGRLNLDRQSTSAPLPTEVANSGVVGNSLGVAESVLNKLDPKWRKLLEANSDFDMSEYINADTKYDDFGVPIIDLGEKQDDELPQISAFGLK